SQPITADHVEQAKERLILARATHLDSLAAKLVEPRVHRVIEPVLAGTLDQPDPYDDDTQYARDLGLIAPTRPVRIANPIYREVIVRVLTTNVEDRVLADPHTFIQPNGQLDFDLLLHEFAAFWCEHADVLTRGTVYHEAAPHLVFMAFLQRIVNGGGHVDRDYGVGRGRIDLLIRWSHTNTTGGRTWQREAIELKVWRKGDPDPLTKGLTQLDGYLDRLHLDTGTPIIFDRPPDAPPIPEPTPFAQTTSPANHQIPILRA